MTPRPVAAAAHGLMFNLGIATTQVCESVAVATQTLLAREMGGLNAALATASKDEAGGEKGSSGKASRAAVLAEKRARSWHIIKVGCGAGGLVACRAAPSRGPWSTSGRKMRTEHSFV